MKLDFRLVTLVIVSLSLLGCTTHTFNDQPLEASAGEAIRAEPKRGDGVEAIRAQPKRGDGVEATMAQAQSGDADAQLRLGYYYEFGRGGLDKDPNEAMKWFHRAAEQGLPSAEYMVAWGYLGRLGLFHDFEKAHMWLRRAAGRGYADAQFLLADEYRSGYSVERNYREARLWYQQAAAQGHGEARLGLVAITGLSNEEEVSPERHLAKAREGDVEAQFRIGATYMAGFGTSPVRDELKAEPWLQKAAEQGHAEAQYWLAVCHSTSHGVAQNSEQAATWYRKAAEQGHPDAAFKAYLDYSMTPAEKVRWLQIAAEGGHVRAQVHLAYCYLFGDNVPKDLPAAYKWANLAATRGDEDGLWFRADLETFLTREQISEGQRLSREFRPRPLP